MDVPTLTREDDPLVVSGATLTPLLNAPLEQLGCFRGVQGKLEPTPCQIDERTSEGDYVLPLGPDGNPEDGDGRLSPHDELVFMARDLGARLAQPMWPEGFQQGLELQITDPRDGGRGYLYLAQFDRRPPRSPVDYVTYIPARETVESLAYSLSFSKTAPIVFDRLVLKKDFGGTGDDPVDRMKIRLEATVWNTFSIVKTENDYTSALVGYIDGPVRVLRRTRNRVVLFWKIPSPSALQDNFFYGTFFEFPVAISLPFDLDTFLSDASLRISVDLEGHPHQVFINSNNPTPVRMDGKTSALETALDLSPARWSVVYDASQKGSAGMVNRLSISANTPLFPHQYYVDDQTRPDAPESTPGQVGNLGYEVKNLKGLTKGTHLLTSVLYCFPRYHPGIEARYLAIKDAPLEVVVSRRFP